MAYSNLVNCHFIDARVRVRLLARIDEKLLTSCFDDFTCDSQDWENNLTSFYAVVCISLRGSSQPVVVKIKSVVAKNTTTCMYIQNTICTTTKLIFPPKTTQNKKTRLS